ncbi:MAG: PAS domain S-box protein [Methanomicrobiales archaeon]|nr:PAS domain S-box protein [Methanomicrobiales archaeon]
MKKISGIEHRIRHADGSWRWYLLTLSPVYDAHGTIISFNGISLDINEKITTQSAIRMMFESIVGTTGIPSLLKIAENITSWLGADCVIVGEIQPDNQTVKALSMILDGREVKDFIYHFKGTPCEDVIKKGFCCYPDEAIRLFPDSRDLVELNIRAYVGVPLKNSRGEIIGFVCALFRNPIQIASYVQDFFSIIGVKAGSEIERFRIERELLENREILANAMNLTNLANWEVDITTGEFIFNDRFYSQCGTTAEQEGGYRMNNDRYIREFVHPDDQQLVTDVILTPATPSESPYVDFQWEHRIIRRDGEVRDILVRTRILKDSERNVIMIHGANQDITERKKAEEVLRRVNRQLNLLTSITRHDILNSLMAIYWFLDAIEHKFSDPVLLEYVMGMNMAAGEIQSQIEFTRVYEELGSHEPAWISLNAVMPYQSVPSHITLTADVTGIAIYADPMLDKVFFNLLDNSIRHGQRVTEIRVSTHESDDNLKVVWEDNGVGVSAAEKESIFLRGFGKHTGFGMFLVQEILSLTDITIQETGREGEGARFEILVPKGFWRK